MNPSPQGLESRRGWLLIVALALAAAAWSMRNGFVYDDAVAIAHNPLPHSLANSARIWSSGYWPAGLLYRPLTMQLFAFEWWVGGGAPWLFHLVNLALYAAVAVLVYRLACRVLGEDLERRLAFAAAAVFAVHPVHVEVVANSVGQSELLAAFFVLLAVERYLVWRERADWGAGRRAALALLTILAIAAKETGYVLPFLLAAAELLVVSDRKGWRSRFREAGPVFTMVASAVVAALLVRIVVFTSLKGEVAAVPLRDLGLAERAVAMLAAVPEWGRLLVWPAHLQAQYGPPELPVSAVLSPAHWFGLALLLLGLSALVLSWRRAPALAFGLAWIAIGIAPVSNLVTATGVIIAERTLFLPSVGLALAAGWCFGILTAPRVGRVTRFAVRVAGLAVIAAGALRSAERAGVWRTQSLFFERLERDAPGSYRAQFSAGTWYLSAKRYSDAERALGSARQLYQDDPAVYETFGQLYRVQKHCDRALPILSEGLSHHPRAIVLRSRTIECAIAVGDSARARALAGEAVAAGQSEFESTLRRLRVAPAERGVP